MLGLIEQMKIGNLSSTSFMNAETTRRTFNLELSRQRDIDVPTDTGIHSLDIERVQFRYMLSGCNNGSIQIYDLYNTSGKVKYTCKRVHSAQAHDHSTDTVQWYPFDTGMLTTSSMDGKLKIWDTAVMKPIDKIKMREKVNHHDMSKVATHNLIAAGMKYPHVVLVDIRTGSQSHELSGHTSEVFSVKWSPCAENLLASGGSEGKIFLWDIRSAKGFLSMLDQHNGEQLTSSRSLVTAHNSKVNGLCFSSDGLYLTSIGRDDRIRLWDVALAKNTFVNYGRVHQAVQKHVQIDNFYNTAVPLLFVPSCYRVRVYDMFKGPLVSEHLGHCHYVNSCIFREHYHELYSSGCDGNILIWSPDVERENLSSEGADNNDTDSQDNWL